MTPLIITVLAQDDPSLVGTLVGVANRHGAIWRDSQFTRLHGHISGTGLLEVEPDNVDALVDELHQLPEAQVATRVSHEPVGQGLPRVTQLHVLGQAHHGVARELISGLAELGLDARDLRTNRHDVDGEEFFGATLMLAHRDELDEQQLAAVVDLAASLGLEAAVDSIFGGID